jgi:hypothetical protein
MSRVDLVLKTAKLSLVLCAGLALIGCQAIREATGAAKVPPDEFTVLTKAPLVLPPDYNLRPPQPGIASRNEPNPEDQARAALFPQGGQAEALGPEYSDAEKTLLTRSGALEADPNIRRSVTTDVGIEDQGPAFAQRVLYPQTATAGTAPAQASVPAQGEAAMAAPAQAEPPQPRSGEPSAEAVLFPQANDAGQAPAVAMPAQGQPAEAVPAPAQAQ